MQHCLAFGSGMAWDWGVRVRSMGREVFQGTSGAGGGDLITDPSAQVAAATATAVHRHPVCASELPPSDAAFPHCF